MKFTISKKNKKRARIRRVRKERKWLAFRIVAWVLFAVAIISFVVGLHYDLTVNYVEFDRCAVAFAITLVLGVIAETLPFNFASHWIQDRLNDRMWMDNNTLYYFQQVAFAAGLNSRSADRTGYVFAYSIDSIRNVRYDEKSRRIEFEADGIGTHYSDVYRETIDRQWPLKGCNAVFYDYFEPSLISVLEREGKSIERKTIEYSVWDNKI